MILAGRNLCVYDVCHNRSGSGSGSATPPAHNCSSYATCTFFGDAVHSCKCLPGFRGDGRVCSPIVHGCMDQDAFNWNPKARPAAKPRLVPYGAHS